MIATKNPILEGAREPARRAVTCLALAALAAAAR